MKATTLVILAAGMGSRFGGTKQIEPVTPGGETILDFSIYDAVNAGFTKIVFVVRREILREFRNLFDAKLEGRTDVSYVCQDDFAPPGSAGKLPGTGHAVLSARDAVDDNFCVVNADDFYGRNSFESIGQWDVPVDAAEFAMIAFKLGNTLSDFGPVSRGQCLVDGSGFLTSVIERTGILSENGNISCNDKRNSESPLTLDSPVSMNFWGFTPVIFEPLERGFRAFQEQRGAIGDTEFYINDFINSVLIKKEASVRVFSSNGAWMGITHRGDRDVVAAKLIEMRRNGVYPKSLWYMKYDIENIFREFDVDAEVVECSPIVSGHINDTFLIKTTDGSFVLQRINSNVFTDPGKVVENKVLVVDHLKSKAAPYAGRGPDVISFRKTRSGGYLLTDSLGNPWNLMNYIEESRVYLKSPNAEIAFEAGKVFGDFLAMTADLDPSLLHETLPRFHSMSLRYAQFDKALGSASDDRIDMATDLIETAEKLRDEMRILEEWAAEGTIPVRVTHNDTKISNALFAEDGRAICVIDLDTVMPGIVHYDFGDSVRAICGTADEDEPEISKVEFNLDYFRSFVRGFVGESGLRLTEAEAKGLARSGKVMTFIIGLRFLTDFLNKDIYFDVRYDTHNLVRARNQFRLAGLIEKNIEAMDEIVMKEWTARKHGDAVTR